MSKRIDLNSFLLGPEFKRHTEDSFIHYVLSLKEEKSIGKIRAPKIPRIKKEKVTHKIHVETKLCLICGKKVRSEKAICSGKPKIKSVETQSVVVNSEAPAQEIPSEKLSLSGDEKISCAGAGE